MFLVLYVDTDLLSILGIPCTRFESFSLTEDVGCHSSSTAANAGHCCTRTQGLFCRMERTGVRRTFRALSSRLEGSVRIAATNCIFLLRRWRSWRLSCRLWKEKRGSCLLRNCFCGVVRTEAEAAGMQLEEPVTQWVSRPVWMGNATSLYSRFDPVYFTLPLPPRVLVLHAGAGEGPRDFARA